MPLWVIPLIFVFFIVLCLAAGIWLLLHMTAVASVFRGKADLVPSPKSRRATRKQVFIALALFAVGLVGVLAMQVGTMEGVSNDAVEYEAG